MKKKKPTVVVIPPETHKMLQTYSANTGTKIRHLVNEAILKYLEGLRSSDVMKG